MTQTARQPVMVGRWSLWRLPERGSIVGGSVRGLQQLVLTRIAHGGWVSVVPGRIPDPSCFAVCFQTGKGLAGLDEHQVRRWTSWRRWTLLAMIGHALLAVIARGSRRRPSPRAAPHS